MTESTVAVLAFLVLGWAITSGTLARHNVTGPLVFAITGYVLGNPDWGPLTIDVEAESIHVIVELALALVLFSDAERVNIAELRRDVSLPVRLLAIGLPLSIAGGGVLAAVILDDIPWALAGFIGAALAPTDAALSAPVINDERIPLRLRRALNVESGLNDGIATPVVSFMLAVAASQIGATTHAESFQAGAALRELAVGALVGLTAGVGGAALITLGARYRLIATGGRRLATFATAIGAFATALALDGNGFISAFVAGIAFGAALKDEVAEMEQAMELTDLGGELLALVVWFLFGAALVPLAFDELDGPILAYAALSLTVVRILPVTLCMSRSSLDRTSVGFLGWFGPRGLASVVFALLAIEELGESSAVVEQAVAAVALTVMLSVVVHGVTAGPGGRRYVQREESTTRTADAPRARRSPASARPGQ